MLKEIKKAVKTIKKAAKSVWKGVKRVMKEVKEAIETKEKIKMEMAETAYIDMSHFLSSGDNKIATGVGAIIIGLGVGVVFILSGVLQNNKERIDSDVEGVKESC